MSNTSIPKKTVVRLWSASAGRCEYEGCNKVLWRDALTLRAMNQAYIAHIVADEADGPRGDPVLSPLLAAEFSNLMLLCDGHHRLVDHEAVAEHPVERLCDMKRRHEDRIEIQTSIASDKKTNLILYGANIGHQSSLVTYERAVEAVVPDRYPASPRPIELGMLNSAAWDHEPPFWTNEAANLRRLFGSRVRDRLATGDLDHLSIFALAPQPLLMLLGSLLSDIPTADVFQLHREPANWKWQDDPAEFEFIIKEPSSVEATAALVLSLSASIAPERIIKVLGPQTSIWEVTVKVPNSDLLKGRGQLRKFRESMRLLLDRIKMRHGEEAILNVFPALPVAAAVEFGRIRMPKADLRVRVFDQNGTQNGFAHALDLDSRWETGGASV